MKSKKQVTKARQEGKTIMGKTTERQKANSKRQKAKKDKQDCTIRVDTIGEERLRSPRAHYQPADKIIGDKMIGA